MKKLSQLVTPYLAIALFALASATFANDGKRGDPAEQLDYIFTQLALDESQQEQVIAVLRNVAEAQRAEMQAVRESHGDERPSREEMKTLREEMRATFRQNLTDELNTILSADLTLELVDYLEAHQRPGMQRGGGK